MEKKKFPRLMVLNEPDGRRFSKALAMEIGRDHAEMFLQIEYLISISSTEVIDDKLWTRESLRDLQSVHFPYWGRTFIAGLLDDLVNGYEHTQYEYSGTGRKFKRTSKQVHIPALLVRAWHNEWPGDTTAWYALNLEGIQTLHSVQLDHFAVQTVSAKRTRVSALQTTGVRMSGNPCPPMRTPSYTEIPTETPTEGGAHGATVTIPEPPPNFPNGLELEEKSTSLSRTDKEHLHNLDKVDTRTNLTKAEQVTRFLGGS